MDNSITCPKCGEEIALSQALTHQIADQITKDLKTQHQKELESVRLKAEDTLTKKIQEKFQHDLKQASEEAEENKARVQKLLEQLTAMTKQMRELKQSSEEAQLQMERTLAKEQDKIRQEAKKQAEDEQHLKILEKEKQLQDAIKANDELRRKLEQGSQQTQGEVLELELEDFLRKDFPNDKIIPVSKGIRGGDITHEVWDSRGNYCGKILWELKNAKAWTNGWVDKLKQDQREGHADIAIIVSEVLPDSVKISGFLNGIWVTQRTFAVCIASALRANLIQLYHTRQSVKGKNEKMEILYAYLSGSEFKHRVEAIVDAFTAMQEEIEKEKRYFMSKWARDEKNIRHVIDNTYGMHGDLKAIVGGVLPQIKGIELPDVERN